MKRFNLKYQQQIFLWVFVTFTCFTIGIMLFQRQWERNIKTENLKTNLDSYSIIIDRYIQKYHLHADATDMKQISTLTEFFPSNLRITIIDMNGNVLFDNHVSDTEYIENHLYRKEIQQSLKEGRGSDIRSSHSTGIDYLYFSHKYVSYFIRIAIPYNIETRNFLHPNNLFLYFVLILFLITFILLTYISRRFGKAITGLYDFIFSIGSDGNNHPPIKFPHTEFGEMAIQIAANYQQLEKTKNQLALEKEKLSLCFQNSYEGIAIFSISFEPVFFNTHFVTYATIIADEYIAISKSLFDIQEFSEVNNFLNRYLQNQENTSFTGKITKNGKYFSIKCIIFHDKTFELILNDITQTETTHLLKQEMTNNIAHELRTPVSSIRGYLETMLEQENLDIQKQRSFLERSYQQTLKLSELIRDISLITKIEEAPQLFIEETIKLSSILHELYEEFEIPLQRNAITFCNNIPENLEVKGNRTLIYSIFRNLMENAIAYAGKDITISINLYNESNVRYFFSFSDTGKGVSEEHLSKVFNRFYRIDEGRTRDSGGSGLGLAIVKNAVLFHQGEIVAKNRKEGGLEFLFTLKK